MLTTPNRTQPTCPLKALKSWASSWCLSHFYSPDLAPCDFFLFGYLKQHLEGKHLTKEDQVIATVREVFDTIPLQTFHNVMDD
jgi:hypothetical protein